MQRLLASLAALPLLATLANAQCFEQNFGVLAPLTGGQAGYGDDVFFDLQPLGFNFPMGGNSATYSHVHISDNGICYLTNGSPSNGAMGAGNGYQNTAYFVGAPGADPRIAPSFADYWSQPGTGGIYINNTIPGKFVITWADVVEWWATTQPGTAPLFTFQAQIFDNGDVRFFYGGTTYGASYAAQDFTRCGLSEGNGVMDPGSFDLSVSGQVQLNSFCLYEEFPVGMWDLDGTEVTFTWAGTGYLSQTTPCTPAFHQNYGDGCYTISDSVYELFADSALASAGLQGESMTLTSAGPEYVVSWGGGTYMPPTAAAVNVFNAPTDDGEAEITPSSPFPTPSGAQPTLRVHSNGVISWGANPQNFPGANNYTPSGGNFNADNSGFWSHHDYSETGATAGRITWEEVTIGADTVVLVTWDDVDSYPLNIANPSNMQFQLNLTNGNCTIVWDLIDNNTTSPFGSGHMIGWSPAGASNDAGSIDISASTPLVTQPLNQDAMTLSASPSPVSGSTAGTTVTYTTDDMLELGGGTYVGLNIVSLGQNATGLDLGFIGAPGCNAYIAMLDFTQAMVGNTSTNTVTFDIPAGVSSGFEIYSQSVALVPPNSLPNGQNAFGLIVSNGVRSFISSF